ncbi:MAG: hypothetical protein ACR2KE_03765 [Candidatus Nanopelagicales bacterium]
MKFLRLTVAAALAAALMAPVATSSASAAPAAADRGLFGAADPTYDGVFRQSTAILGLAAAGVDVPPSALQWLLRQQCKDGSFAAYRSDPSAACPAPDPQGFTGPDTNSTALAALALDSLKGRAAARAAAQARAWLRTQELPGGGWEWIAGLGPDSISTAMVLSALGPAGSALGQRGVRWLGDQVLVDDSCAVRFQPGATADPLSTAWAFTASQGTLPFDPVRGPRKPAPSCSIDSRPLASTGQWLAQRLIATSGRIPDAFDPTATDWNSTALATLGMTQRNGSRQAMLLGTTSLKAHVDAYVVRPEGDSPTALGTLISVAHAAGDSPRTFGGTNLIARLLATLQRS